MADQTDSDNQLDLTARLEALLFVAPSAVSPAQLAAALEVSTGEVENGLAKLEASYADAQRGLRVQRHRGGIQLTTSPAVAPLVERFLSLEATSRLSQAALEALAIVAYEQPVTRPRVDAIRGVNSDTVLKSLLNKGIIEEVGRAETPGRPILYCTTSDFLQYFGLNSLDELPPLSFESPEETAADGGLSAGGGEGAEDSGLSAGGGEHAEEGGLSAGGGEGAEDSGLSAGGEERGEEGGLSGGAVEDGDGSG